MQPSRDHENGKAHLLRLARQWKRLSVFLLHYTRYIQKLQTTKLKWRVLLRNWTREFLAWTYQYRWNEYADCAYSAFKITVCDESFTVLDNNARQYNYAEVAAQHASIISNKISSWREQENFHTALNELQRLEMTAVAWRSHFQLFPNRQEDPFDYCKYISEIESIGAGLDVEYSRFQKSYNSLSSNYRSKIWERNRANNADIPTVNKIKNYPDLECRILERLPPPLYRGRISNLLSEPSTRSNPDFNKAFQESLLRFSAEFERVEQFISGCISLERQKTEPILPRVEAFDDRLEFYSNDEPLIIGKGNVTFHFLRALFLKQALKESPITLSQPDLLEIDRTCPKARSKSNDPIALLDAHMASLIKKKNFENQNQFFTAIRSSKKNVLQSELPGKHVVDHSSPSSSS